MKRLYKALMLLMVLVGLVSVPVGVKAAICVDVSKGSDIYGNVPKSRTILLEEGRDVGVTVNFFDKKTKKHVSYVPGRITCTSSNPKVLAVDKPQKDKWYEGISTTAKKAGTSTLTIKIKGGKTYKCKVTVKKKVYRAKLSAKKKTIYVGDSTTLSLSVKGNPKLTLQKDGERAKDNSVYWCTRDYTKIARIEVLSPDKVKVTGVKAGTIEQDVIYKNPDGFSETCTYKIVVKNKPKGKPVLSDTKLTVVSGDEARIAIGNVKTGKLITWSAPKDSCYKFDAVMESTTSLEYDEESGVLYGSKWRVDTPITTCVLRTYRVGTYTVSAKVDGKTYKCQLKVKPSGKVRFLNVVDDIKEGDKGLIDKCYVVDNKRYYGQIRSITSSDPDILEIHMGKINGDCGYVYEAKKRGTVTISLDCCGVVTKRKVTIK